MLHCRHRSREATSPGSVRCRCGVLDCRPFGSFCGGSCLAKSSTKNNVVVLLGSLEVGIGTPWFPFEPPPKRVQNSHGHICPTGCVTKAEHSYPSYCLVGLVSPQDLSKSNLFLFSLWFAFVVQLRFSKARKGWTEGDWVLLNRSSFSHALPIGPLRFLLCLVKGVLRWQ